MTGTRPIPGPSVEVAAWNQIKHWMLAVETQHERVMAGPPVGLPRGEVPRVQANMTLYILALYLLRRAVVFASREAAGGEALLEAISAFDQAVPDLIYTRDFIEHFDDWERGEGRRQSVGEDFIRGLGMSTIDVSFGHTGRGIGTFVSTPATRTLFNAARDVLELLPPQWRRQ